MELIYQNDTFYVLLEEKLDHQEYWQLKERLFRIFEEYGIDRVVIKNNRALFHNRQYLSQMKQDYMRKYTKDFIIE